MAVLQNIVLHRQRTLEDEIIACFLGRITVRNILELVSEGISFEKIILDYYPEIKIDDIQACLNYAIDVVSAADIHISTT